MNHEWIFLLAILNVILMLILGAIYSFKKLNKLVQRDKSEAKNYGREITIGLTSALIIIILDRTINAFTSNFSKVQLDTSSIFNFFSSIMGIILALILGSSFILFCVVWVICIGFPKK